LRSHTLVRGGHVMTMDPDTGAVAGGDVLISDGRITAVGACLDAPDGCEIINAAGTIVLPGLIDGHRHLWQSLLRGTAADWTLAEYMVQARSMYCSCFDTDAAYLGNYLGGLESLDAGITTVVDHSHLQKSPEVTDALARGLLDSGVGGVFCYALQNVPDFTEPGPIRADDVKDLLMGAPASWHDDNARAVRERYFHDPAQRLRFGVALPETAPYVPIKAQQELLARTADLRPFLMTGHWHGGGERVLGALTAGGDWPPQTSLTHCNHLDDGDLDVLVQARVGVCTTPDTECGMRMGPLAAGRFSDRGGRASLGTDLSSYARADILLQARLLLQVERMSPENPDPKQIWPARRVLELATQQAAESLGLGSEVGSLTAGKRADVVIVRPASPAATPWGDPVASLLFYTSPAEIDTVLVEGQVLKRDGVLVHSDLPTLQRRVADAASRVRARFDQLPRAALQSVWAEMFG
jgi:cytosine/adenosine deaminase-related metal-dependent hydrolase